MKKFFRSVVAALFVVALSGGLAATASAASQAESQVATPVAETMSTGWD